jgi:16S rRNA processing protein RimM
MEKHNCYLAGYIAKTHGLKGELSLTFSKGEIEELKEMESVFVEINNKLLPFFIEEISVKSNKTAIARFKEIETLEQAQSLVRSNLFIPVASTPSTTHLLNYPYMIGFKVIDTKEGELGTINEIEEFPAQTIAQIQLGGKEILFPVNETTVVKIDIENKTLHVCLPDGLLDIYR